MYEDAEKFICRIYKIECQSCDEARIKLFSKCHATEALPPSSDAARYHMQRASYQSFISREVCDPMPNIPSPAESWWKIVSDSLAPVLTSLPPIPKACKNIVQCGCTKGCMTKSCSCRKWWERLCTDACKCSDAEVQCRNRAK